MPANERPAGRLDKPGALLVSATLVALLGAVGQAIPAPQRSEEITVGDPRPLSEAARVFEGYCHCIVTYEDIKWRADQVQDISANVRRRPDSPMPRIPKGRPFTFTVTSDLATRTSDEVGKSLGELLAAFDRVNEPMFQVLAGDRVFHIVPKSGSVLTARLSIPRTKRSLFEQVNTVLEVLRQITGERVQVATGPLNLLKRQVEDGANSERAVDVIDRMLLLETGRKLSWQLLYDFGMQSYYLNIHVID